MRRLGSRLSFPQSPVHKRPILRKPLRDYMRGSAMSPDEYAAAQWYPTREMILLVSKISDNERGKL